MSSKRPSRAPSLPPPLADSVFPPKVPSEADDTAMRMTELFERGKAALVAYVEALPYGKPLGWERFGAQVLAPIRAITAADHDENARLVRRYICTNKAVVSVLCEDELGGICSVHEIREVKHW